jgi:nucleotide-binding universal stress UspA family protein
VRVSDILVPIDFSPNSLHAYDFAKSLVDPDGEILLLHVIDSDFVSRLRDEGFESEEGAVSRLREKATIHFDEILQSVSKPGPQVDSMVVVGKPFTEILRMSVDLDFQMIVLGMHGRRSDSIEHLLFGSTAEKVLRGARIPVICVPYTPA